MAREVAHQMGVGDAVLENLEIAAILHVIGKAAVPEDMLSKSQAYTSEETEFVKEHLRLGLDLCRTTTVSSAVTDILAHARGMIDDADSAAPNQQILVGGAILHMIDTFIAMTSNRPHRKRMSISEALDELRHACATPQDSEIVNVITSIGSRAETQDYRWAA
ncbi:MAG: HD-GYP domain-containing protein [Phycisphaerales bacterium]